MIWIEQTTKKNWCYPYLPGAKEFVEVETKRNPSYDEFMALNDAIEKFLVDVEYKDFFPPFGGSQRRFDREVAVLASKVISGEVPHIDCPCWIGDVFKRAEGCNHHPWDL